jgi:putative ABC transport system permease protein
MRSLRRTPTLSALMIATIAVGIAASMVTITLYHARAGHPIPWKENTLYAVALDNRDDEPDPGVSAHPEYPPWMVTYLDAKALYRSDIPRRSVMMFRGEQVITPQRANAKPLDVIVRVTTADFFGAFDVPFQYGGGWPRSADEALDNVVVLSKYANDKVFGGENSLGREIVLSGRSYRVIGVLAAWAPEPRYYDMNGSGPQFDVPEDVFVPFGWGIANRLEPWRINCVSKRARLENYDSYFTQDCGWLQYWVELDSSGARERYQSFVDNYVREQKRLGRFPRPLNNRIVNVSTWLEMNNVVGDDSRMEAVLAVAFLGVCVLNTFGLMLAKFLSSARIAGLRRALGASRMNIVRQHLIEVVLVGLIGGAVGLVLTYVGLRLLRVVLFTVQLTDNDNPARTQLMQSLSQMDFTMILWGIALSMLTGVLAGLYPAWRIGRLAPATFLKTQ